MFYEEVFRKLAERKVRYAVAGGIALVLHGAVRFTADLDLIVDLSPDNLNTFIPAINDLGYRPRLPVKTEDFADPLQRKHWIAEKEMTVFTFYHPERPISEIDVFVREPLEFDVLERELVWIRARDVAIPVVSLHHLKMLKRAAGRPQDLADIEALEELERSDEG
jgi:plastocyanin domain-containing protein